MKSSTKFTTPRTVKLKTAHSEKLGKQLWNQKLLERLKRAPQYVTPESVATPQLVRLNLSPPQSLCQVEHLQLSISTWFVAISHVFYLQQSNCTHVLTTISLLVTPTKPEIICLHYSSPGGTTCYDILSRIQNLSEPPSLPSITILNTDIHAKLKSWFICRGLLKHYWLYLNSNFSLCSWLAMYIMYDH